MIAESDAIDLWFAYPEKIHDVRLLAAYNALLTDDELSRARRFRAEGDRHAYVVARALVRVVLSRYTSLQPRELAFTANPYGKPELLGHHDIHQKLCFSLSHTPGLTVLAVARERQIGVDVENADQTLVAPLALARRVLSPRELSAWFALPKVLRSERIVSVWTVKEAYMKARGVGLAIPFSRLSIVYEARDNRTSMSITGDPESDASRWYCRQLRIASNHFVALCFDRGGRTIPRVCARTIVPLGEELWMHDVSILIGEVHVQEKHAQASAS